jgi:hypothetical protein
LLEQLRHKTITQIKQLVFTNCESRKEGMPNLKVVLDHHIHVVLLAHQCGVHPENSLVILHRFPLESSEETHHKQRTAFGAATGHSIEQDVWPQNARSVRMPRDRPQWPGAAENVNDRIQHCNIW